MSFNQQILRCLVLAILFGLGADASAADKRQRPSAEEVRTLGEDPEGGEFYRLNLDPRSANADQLTPNGGSGTFYTSIAASEFRPRSSHVSFNVPNNTSLTCQVDSTNSLAEAQLQLTHGATLQFMRIYGNDSSDQDLNVALLERCQPTASAGNVITTVLASTLTSGAGGLLTQSIGFPPPTTIDNNLCVYSLRVQLGSTVNGCGGGLLLDKVRVQWIQ